MLRKIPVDDHRELFRTRLANLINPQHELLNLHIYHFFLYFCVSNHKVKMNLRCHFKDITKGYTNSWNTGTRLALRRKMRRVDMGILWRKLTM
jgi:hypothetical protein